MRRIDSRDGFKGELLLLSLDALLSPPHVNRVALDSPRGGGGKKIDKTDQRVSEGNKRAGIQFGDLDWGFEFGV